MRITVDANEARSGLAEMLRPVWNDVAVRRLDVGDVLIGERVAIERKTAADFVASLADGRLFRQAFRLVGAAKRPVLLVEGEPDPEIMDPGNLRGVLLAMAVGYRIPVIRTADLAETVDTIRHMAAQESRREARRRRRDLCRMENGATAIAAGEAEVAIPPSPEFIDMLASIPGVGRFRARTLADRFGSMGALATADTRRLMQVPGIGPLTAVRILDVLHGRRGFARRIRPAVGDDAVAVSHADSSGSPSSIV